MPKLRLVDLKQIKSILEDLLPPGGYSKVFKPETDAELLARLSKKYPGLLGKNPGEDRIRLRQVLEDRAKEAPTDANKKMLDDFYKEFYGLKETSDDVVSQPKSSILTKEQMFEKRALDKAKKDSDKTPILPASESTKRAASIAALTGGGLAASSLMPEEAEAGVKGSAAARRKLLETTEKVMDAWTSGKKGASGGRELREQLQSQLDLDPTGAAKKEVLRRLTAKTEVRQNPITGEHEFKVYRGGIKDRFSESPQSFTTDPEVAQEFADAYGGTVKEVWLPASKVGSVPSVMKEGKYLSSEGEVIAKPFKAESVLYTPKKESLHQRISERGKPAESTDLYEGWPEDIAEMARKSSKAAAIGGAIGVGTLAAPSAQASEGPAVSQSNPEFTSDVAQSESKDPLSHFEQKYGTYDIPGGVEKLLETVDKYTGRPARAAALSALKGESPVTGAIESVSKDQDVEGRQIARQFLQNLEDRGFRTRAPVDPKLEQLRELGVEIEGKKPEEYLPLNEFPAEGPLGFAADVTLDPTNLAGMGLGTKVGKGFSKVRGLMK